MTLGISSAQYTIKQVEEEVKSWLDSWLKTVNNNIQAIESEVSKKIQEPILNAYMNIADIVSEIDQQLVNKWAEFYETASVLKIPPWQGKEGEYAVPTARPSSVIKQPAAINPIASPTNPVGSSDSGSFGVTRQGGSSGQGYYGYYGQGTTSGQANGGPVGVSQTNCLRADGSIGPNPDSQGTTQWRQQPLGWTPTQEMVDAGITIAPTFPGPGTWQVRVCIPCNPNVQQCGPPPPPPPNGGGSGGGGTGGGGVGVCPNCGCPPATVNCPPPQVVVNCDYGTKRKGSDKPFPVDEDQPLAFILGDWDDEYFDNIAPFTGDWPRRFRNGEDPKAVEDEAWQDWPK